MERGQKFKRNGDAVISRLGALDHAQIDYALREGRVLNRTQQIENLLL
jgi:hypothetical protein